MNRSDRIELADRLDANAGRWMSEGQVAILLGLGEVPITDLGILVAGRLHGDRLLFEATDVARLLREPIRSSRDAEQAREREEASDAADALLAEMRAAGLDIGPLGGDAA